MAILVIVVKFSAKFFWKEPFPKLTFQITHLAKEDVIAKVRIAIHCKWPEGHEVQLTVTEQPRLANGMVWSIRETAKGSWWEAKVDDVTGELILLERKGLR